MGGITSTRVTRPSAVTQNLTSCRRPRTSLGAPGGVQIVHRGEAWEISLPLPPEPEPVSAPVPVPVPVPFPPPVPGPCPGPPVVPTPAPIAAGGRTAAVVGISIFTGSGSGTETVGTVTVGAAGMSQTSCSRPAGRHRRHHRAVQHLRLLTERTGLHATRRAPRSSHARGKTTLRLAPRAAVGAEAHRNRRQVGWLV